jgi:hypothetical protein
MRLIPQLMQFEIGISTNLYFPAIGTAGFERLAVSGYKRVPAPPPSMTAKISWLILLGDSFWIKDDYLSNYEIVLAFVVLIKLACFFKIHIRSLLK